MSAPGTERTIIIRFKLVQPNAFQAVVSNSLLIQFLLRFKETTWNGMK